MLIIKVKQARMSKGLTQRELSVMTGISKSSLDRIEKGSIKVAAEDLFAIAHALKIPVDDLCEYHYIEKDPQSG